jgi:hypothetical protein
MATHVMTTPKKGIRHIWVPLLVVIALVALIGVAFAAGRNSVSNPTPPRAATQSALGAQLTGMVPWVRNHTGDIKWMQGHIGDVAWMQGHPTQWQWMQGHIGNIAWMQAHPTQWQGCRPTCGTSGGCTTTGASGPGGARAQATGPTQVRTDRTDLPTGDGTVGSGASSSIRMTQFDQGPRRRRASDPSP